VKTIPEAGGKLDAPPPAYRLICLLTTVGEEGSKVLGKGLAAEYYGSFYEALVESKSVSGFVALALAGDQTPEISAWRSQTESVAKKAAEVVAAYKWIPPQRPPLPADGGPS
jgi:hypothetical protein